MAARTVTQGLNIFSKFLSVKLWNSRIKEAVNQESAQKALLLFCQMKQKSLEPNNLTFPFVAKACAKLSDLKCSQSVHSQILKSPFGNNIFIQTAVVDMYVKCDKVDYAYKLFERMSERDLAAWNAMLLGFAQLGFLTEVFSLLDGMRFAGIHPDSVTVVGLRIRPDASSIVSLISSCVQPEALFQGTLIHSHGIKLGCDLNLSVTNTLISMYSKCGDVNSARLLFDCMSDRTHVSWTVMISGYAEKGNINEAMSLFFSMEKVGETPDLVTILSLLSGCSKTGSLELGKLIDSYAKSKEFKDNIMVCNALIDMYSKCGSILEAKEVFHAMREKTIVSWTTMISGCAMNGQFEEALDLFHQMRSLGLKPNHITFLAVLQACTHAGFLDKGWEFFNMMTMVYDINPGLDHYSCMADLLGRKGKLKEALEFVLNMPIEPDAAILCALLSACKVHQNIEIGKYVASRLFEMEPQEAAPYVEMANIYASTGKWDRVAMIRLLMKHNKVSKSPGESLIQINGKTHRFTVEDRSNSEGVLIFTLLDDLALQLKDDGYLLHLGYIPELEFI
ncbi:hypothetical protein PVK06_008097 [Gossypium arboreum]|uniref:Pentatricopeptide repeat-containing protein At4g19191, mitochondrial n=1 Tax=Gossypium arboreum TaxID=29729 RepID=A0ABR0QJ40_GOSAR|nr:hypothetical protein PVK06_008097 [Gossypium arboreum]